MLAITAFVGAHVRRALFSGALSVLCFACASQPPVAQRVALLIDAGDLDDAQALLDDHLVGEPRDVEARRLRIRVWGLRGDLGRAGAEAAELAKIVGESDPRPWLELGHAHELSHRYDEALIFYDQAAEVAPADTRGPRVGGLRAARWGRLDWAEPRLKEALARDPHDAEVWHALGLVHVHQGRLDDAMRAYQRGLDEDASALENRIGLANVALRRHRYEEALHHYAELTAARPTLADAHLGRAYALLRLRRFDEAHAAVEQARAQGADAGVCARLDRQIAHER